MPAATPNAMLRPGGNTARGGDAGRSITRSGSSPGGDFQDVRAALLCGPTVVEITHRRHPEVNPIRMLAAFVDMADDVVFVTGSCLAPWDSRRTDHVLEPLAIDQDGGRLRVLTADYEVLMTPWRPGQDSLMDWSVAALEQHLGGRGTSYRDERDRVMRVLGRVTRRDT